MAFTQKDLAEITRRLGNPDIQCFSAVLMARRDLNAGNHEAAVCRLRIDADKIRPLDAELYRLVTMIQFDRL
jgi:hypothetical protein